MFFLARSAFCIGLVAYALPAAKGPETLRSLANSAQAVATDHLDRLCSGCTEARVAKLVLSGSLARLLPVPRQKSVSTLLPSDLATAWAGPTRHS